MSRLGEALRFASLLSALAAIFSIGYGAVLLYNPTGGNSSGAVLRVKATVESVGDVPLGAEIPVTFTATNLSDEPFKLLGAEGTCMPLWHDYDKNLPVRGPSLGLNSRDEWVAWGSATDFPASIPPRSIRKFTIRLRVRPTGYTGDFVGRFILYSDAPGCEHTPLWITGSAVQLTAR